MGLLSGLASFGLENLEKMSIFEEKKEKEISREAAAAASAVVLTEEDFIYDKYFDCPVCNKKIIAKVVKSGKAKLAATDVDLRPKYEVIDTNKYGAILCPECGFAALPNYFIGMAPSQRKAIQENICKNITVKRYNDSTYSYEEALERYKLALACAVVKRAKNSEKAYVCLKTAWVIRGYLESGELDDKEEKKAEMKAMEEECIQNAFKGFLEARQTEGFPMCGMDESTIDYLLGALAYLVKDYDVSARMVQSLMSSKTASKRAKDKAYALKELIIQAKKG